MRVPCYIRMAQTGVEPLAVGFIFGVIQDSVETALNSSGDVFFTATAEEFDRKKKGEERRLSIA